MKDKISEIELRAAIQEIRRIVDRNEMSRATTWTSKIIEILKAVLEMLLIAESRYVKNGKLVKPKVWRWPGLALFFYQSIRAIIKATK